MSLKDNKKEQLFYKRVGKFITILQSKDTLYRLTNNLPKVDCIRDLISNEMLCNYKKGRSKISLYKFIKISQCYGYDLKDFLLGLVDYLKNECERDVEND